MNCLTRDSEAAAKGNKNLKLGQGSRQQQQVGRGARPETVPIAALHRGSSNGQEQMSTRARRSRREGEGGKECKDVKGWRWNGGLVCGGGQGEADRDREQMKK